MSSSLRGNGRGEAVGGDLSARSRGQVRRGERAVGFFFYKIAAVGFFLQNFYLSASHLAQIWNWVAATLAAADEIYQLPSNIQFSFIYREIDLCHSERIQG